jgi:hypothetical protein
MLDDEMSTRIQKITNEAKLRDTIKASACARVLTPLSASTASRVRSTRRPPAPTNMSPKKKQRGQQQPLTEAELAERVCSECRVPVPGAFTWLDPATQQACYGTCFACRELLAQVSRAEGTQRAAPSAPAPSVPLTSAQLHTARQADQAIARLWRNRRSK